MDLVLFHEMFENKLDRVRNVKLEIFKFGDSLDIFLGIKCPVYLHWVSLSLKSLQVIQPFCGFINLFDISMNKTRTMFAIKIDLFNILVHLLL